MPHYALVTDDGDALGSVELEGDESAWPNGSVIEGFNGRDWRVVGYVESDHPENFAVLVVEPIGEAVWPTPGGGDEQAGDG